MKTTRMKHPHMSGVEIDVPGDRVASHERAGWLRKRPKRGQRNEDTETPESASGEALNDSEEETTHG